MNKEKIEELIGKNFELSLKKDIQKTLKDLDDIYSFLSFIQSCAEKYFNEMKQSGENPEKNNFLMEIVFNFENVLLNNLALNIWKSTSPEKRQQVLIQCIGKIMNLFLHFDSKAAKIASELN